MDSISVTSPLQVVVVGCGYVGLVSGACLADVGHSVICVDRDVEKIALIESGELPVYEPGLAELIARVAAAGRFRVTSDLLSVIRGADAIFIAVGTPARSTDGVADLSQVYEAVDQLSGNLRGRVAVIVKSTVPVGTADHLELMLRTRSRDAEISVVSNPEFLREGAAIHDFMRPDRIVAGVGEAAGRSVVERLFAPLVDRGTPIVLTTRRSAELIKYASNAFLAVKLTFINEVADLCEAAGADVVDVARGMGLDARIGSRFLNAGPGYGGSCFPKDTLALVRTAQDFGSPLRTIETIVSINEARKRAMARKVVRACGGSVRGQTIAVLGLTFKPDTDDVRESPAISIIRALEDFGAVVRAFDPKGMDAGRRLLPSLKMCDDPYHAASGADALVIVTEWEAFRTLDLTKLRETMRTPRLVDLRNIYDAGCVVAAGLEYTSVGRVQSTMV